MRTPKGHILILGAGPTGLGAGYRLTELGVADWSIWEANGYPGGLAASFEDPNGFTWDLGGHVMFSHFDYYDRAYDRVMQEDYYEHWRESYIWALNRFVRYPFQNNLSQLPEETALECMMGLVEAHCRMEEMPEPRNFQDWIMQRFGAGIAKHFMLPYNFKVWAHPLDRMDYDWIAERVSVVDLEAAIRNLVRKASDERWGPNERFRFPKVGGTGNLWQRFALSIDREVQYNRKAVAIDLLRREIRFSDGEVVGYRHLVSTIPLDTLIYICQPVPDEVRTAAANLVSNRVFVVGIGVKQPCPSSKNWIYFPGEETPFYRVTYLSNYSPAMVPEAGGPYYSLLCETSDSQSKPQDVTTVVDDTVAGLLECGLLKSGDDSAVVTRSLYTVEKAYPVPTIELEHIWKTCRAFLEPKGVLSRGRFGAWQYKIGNMDHSFMQGVEAVDRILFDKPETVLQR